MTSVSGLTEPGDSLPNSNTQLTMTSSNLVRTICATSGIIILIVGLIPQDCQRPFYGYERISSLAARFVTRQYHCPAITPENLPAMSPGQGRMPPTPPALDHFISYAILRTQVPEIVVYASLFLLQRLKARYPRVKCTSGHRVFIAAFMLASKVICDENYSNKSYCVVAQGMFSLPELNKMEREMCSYLDWQLNVDHTVLGDFVTCVDHLFSDPGAVHECHIPIPMLVKDDSAIEPITYAPAQMYTSDPTIEASLPSTPGTSYSESASPASVRAPRTPPDIVSLEHVSGTGINAQARQSWHAHSSPGNAGPVSLDGYIATEHVRNRANAILGKPGSKKLVPSPTMRSKLQVGRDMYAYSSMTFW